VLSAEDLRTLAAASRAVLGAVVGGARDSAVTGLRARREEAAQQRRAPRRQGLARRLTRRLVKLALLVALVVLLLVAGAAAWVAHLAGAF
jgi:hypothetical protein